MKRLMSPMAAIEAGRHRQVDAGDGQQPLDRRIVERRARDLPVENVQILVEPIEFAHMPLDGGALVIGDAADAPARPGHAR